jgi:hypothetical protein
MKGGDLKKAKFHYEATAMAGLEVARFNLGVMEGHSGNIEQLDIEYCGISWES